MTIRTGVKWTDGTALTPADVAYSFNLLKIPTHPQHPLWTDTGLKHVAVRGNTVVFTFGRSPGYQEFDFYRFNVVVVPQHVFKGYSNTDLTTGNLQNPKKLVGTGPYVYQSGIGAASKTVVWKKNPNWWATKAARAQRRPAVRRRHQERHERRRSVESARREHRPVQQLRAKVRDQGRVQDVHPEGALPPRREHDLAVPEHDEEAAQRPEVPAGAGRVDQHGPDHRQGLPGAREHGEPDRPAADLEQVDRQEGRRAVRLLVQPRQGQGDPRGRRLQGHERRRVRREQGRVGDRSQDRRPERMVRLDDRDPGHLRQREGRSASRSRRATRTTRRSSTTAGTGGSTCCSATTGR